MDGLLVRCAGVQSQDPGPLQGITDRLTQLPPGASVGQRGLQWRQHRRAFHLSFGIDRVANHHPIQLNSARRLLSRLLTSPNNIKENINK